MAQRPPSDGYDDRYDEFDDGDFPQRPRGAGQGSTHAARSRGGDPGGAENRPYNTYSSRPRGLMARLRGENDAEIEERAQKRARPRSGGGGRGAGAAGPVGGLGAAGGQSGDGQGAGGAGYGGGGGRGAGGRGPGAPSPGYDRGGRPSGNGQLADGGSGPPPRRRRGLLRPRAPRVPGGRLAFLMIPMFGLPWLNPLRIIKTLILAVIGWIVLSIVLFFISASNHAGNLPKGAQAALTSSGPILTSANNVLILGLDNRPTTGYSSKEGGASHSQKDARTDTIMIWRVGGGVSRRLSIPRDTLVNLPGFGPNKINAAWPFGGPQLTIQTVEHLTGVKINHIILVDLGNFPKFIDDIGGVTVKTPKICSQISGGRKNGGFTLNLRRGTHHLNGTQAMTLARTRENSCNPAYNDLNREAMQQEILNGIKSQLFTMHTFFHLPWAAWDAPGVVQTDMGPLSLLQLFAAAEIGGSSKPDVLKESGSVVNGQDVLLPNTKAIHRQVHKLLTGK